ncbi:MAG: hypothetical protein QHC67_01950 [Sphingobium sp.]|uniref:hypothetical protein n=1 Tax=Sphingobium sp. TaxID=1912891 RepID=UPI0029AB78E4|nr:hypothetical protein [Sphingobium sp.]MDX3908570.1 hypothetical protein [Sphingobium sp.]
MLLIDAMARLCSIEAASRMIVVDPIDENAGTFYGRYGFAPLGQMAARLYLPMKVARKAVGAASPPRSGSAD